MKILNWDFGAGKTTELVRMMLEPGNEDVIYVAPTKAQAHALGYRTAITTFQADPSPELALRFITAAQLRDRRGRNERYVIDEIEGVLGVLLRGEVVAIAGTDEDKKKEYPTRYAGLTAD